MQLLGSNGLLTLSESSLGVGLRDACRRPPSAALCDLCLRHDSRLFTRMQSQASHMCEIFAGSNMCHTSVTTVLEKSLDHVGASDSCGGTSER